MYDKKLHSFCSEFYTIEKSIEVIVRIQGESERIRIDLLRDEETKIYSTKAYIEKYFTLQPAYFETSGPSVSSPQNLRVWVDYDLPWIHQDSAEVALRQALGFLQERCSNV